MFRGSGGPGIRFNEEGWLTPAVHRNKKRRDRELFSDRLLTRGGQPQLTPELLVQGVVPVQEAPCQSFDAVFASA